MFNWLRKQTPAPSPATAPSAAPATGASEARPVNQAAPQTSDDHKARGNALFAEGRHAEAAVCFRDAIAANPLNAPAYFNLGLVLREQGFADEAAASFGEAARIDPQMADATHLVGAIRMQQGKSQEAITQFRAALAADPTLEAATGDLCMALFQQGQIAEAASVIEAGLARNPQAPQLQAFKGNLLQHEGKSAEAVACYRLAIARQPDFPEAQNNLGLTLQSQGEHQAALHAFDAALALVPGYAQAQINRGAELAGLRRWNDALAAFTAALPGATEEASARLHNQIGQMHIWLGRYSQAHASFTRALQISPAFAPALANLATALGLLKRPEEALAAYEHLFAVAPEHDFAIGFLLGAKMQACDWTDRDRLLALAVAGIEAGQLAVVPFPWLGMSDSPELQWKCSRITQQARYPQAAHPLWRGERYTHERIRVAYLSADLHDHATAYLMAGLFELHDHRRFETIALSFGPHKDDAMRRRLVQAFDQFIDVRDRSDHDIAALMRELEIDIAVDLKGYTTDARPGILALRPAPVQLSYIGFPGTMAADYIDYFIADALVVSEEDERWFSEKIVYLPDSYQPNDRARRVAAQTPPRVEQGLPEDGFVFCCFNNNYKITPDVFDVWMRLLLKVPGSVLWLLQDNDGAARNLRREAAARGVDESRLVFAPRVTQEAHLARQRLADLFLDTLPCNAHTTTSDALWVGLPVLTRMGRAFHARVAGSLLHAVGLPELVTRTVEEYEAMALKLATQPQELATLRSKLQGNRDTAPLFDTDRLRRHLESAYMMMWQRAQDGLPSASFDVVPLAV
jgi:protein O-GlcNAc transferase